MPKSRNLILYLFVATFSACVYCSTCLCTCGLFFHTFTIHMLRACIIPLSKQLIQLGLRCIHLFLPLLRIYSLIIFIKQLLKFSYCVHLIFASIVWKLAFIEAWSIAIPAIECESDSHHLICCPEHIGIMSNRDSLRIRLLFNSCKLTLRSYGWISQLIPYLVKRCLLTVPSCRRISISKRQILTWHLKKWMICESCTSVRAWLCHRHEIEISLSRIPLHCPDIVFVCVP